MLSRLERDELVRPLAESGTGQLLYEIVLLAGPAFAVSARRRSRDLALVAAAGGTPAQIRRIMLADGVVLGAIGAAGPDEVSSTPGCGRRFIPVGVLAAPYNDTL